MTEFYNLAGQMALGSRLRRIGDLFAAEAKEVYQLYDVEIDPKWFPVFYMLTKTQEASVTELAERVGQTHPAISQVVREMTKAGVAETKRCLDDGRVSRVQLTKKGIDISQQLEPQCMDVNRAVDKLFRDAGIDLWSALDAVEHELEKCRLFDRVKAVKRQRDVQQVDIVPFKPEHGEKFKTLNETWIKKHWVLEDSDYQSLENPQATILDKGGYIAIALYNQEGGRHLRFDSHGRGWIGVGQDGR